MLKAKEEKTKVARIRMVVQANDFIRHSRGRMSAQELNMVYFWISKIKPTDTDLLPITFTIAEFYEVCGIDQVGGKDHKEIKKVVRALADKSEWVILRNGDECLVRWLDMFVFKANSSTITIELAKSLKPFLLQLIKEGNYTQSELINFLAMRSMYSKRLYEILKSYQNRGYRPIIKDFEMDEIKELLSAENYERYNNFKRKVLDVAMREINEYTDTEVSYTAIKKGRKYTGISFTIQLKKPLERLIAGSQAEAALDT